MATRTPQLQTRSTWPRDWGNYASRATLPNASGNAIGNPDQPRLEAGDTAYVTGSRRRFYCTSPGTLGGGNATWKASVVFGATVAVAFSAIGAYSGSFTIVDADIAVGDTITVGLASGPYPGKGTLPDEAQMYPGFTLIGTAQAGSILVNWSAPRGSVISGTLNIAYQVG